MSSEIKRHMTPEEKENDFFEMLADGRDLYKRVKVLHEAKASYYANIRQRGHSRKIAKEIIRRFESDDPLSFQEHDEQLTQVIEKYSKFLNKKSSNQNLARELLRASGPGKSPIAATIPQTSPRSPDGPQATAADSTKPPGELSAANSDTAAGPGEAAAAVSAPSTKADDAVVVVRTPKPLAPVFARYKNGAHP